MGMKCLAQGHNIAPGEDRTRDLPIKGPTLSQLSYRCSLGRLERMADMLGRMVKAVRIDSSWDTISYLNVIGY